MSEPERGFYRYCIAGFEKEEGERSQKKMQASSGKGKERDSPVETLKETQHH